jgi:hypothetical protein
MSELVLERKPGDYYNGTSYSKNLLIQRYEPKMFGMT